MSAPLQEIRAMLLQFERSRLRDLYYRSRDWTIFMARPDGGPNPLRGEVEEEGVPSIDAESVTAPHLGLFAPRCRHGQTVAAGAVLAVIDVLGRETPILANRAGTVRSLKEAGALVEYEDRLAEIVAG